MYKHEINNEIVTATEEKQKTSRSIGKDYKVAWHVKFEQEKNTTHVDIYADACIIREKYPPGTQAAE